MGGGLITRSQKKKLITETEIRITTSPYREAGVQDATTQLDQRAKQRLTYKPPMNLLSPKACAKIGQWNVRSLFETGKCAQVVKEMQRYGISIVEVSEMRWNSCGRFANLSSSGNRCTRERMEVKIMSHEKGVGFILSKEAAQCLLEWEPVSESIIRARFNSRWQQVTILQCYATSNEVTEAKGQFL